MSDPTPSPFDGADRPAAAVEPGHSFDDWQAARWAPHSDAEGNHVVGSQGRNPIAERFFLAGELGVAVGDVQVSTYNAGEFEFDILTEA